MAPQGTPRNPQRLQALRRIAARVCLGRDGIRSQEANQRDPGRTASVSPCPVARKAVLCPGGSGCACRAGRRWHAHRAASDIHASFWSTAEVRGRCPCDRATRLQPLPLQGRAECGWLGAASPGRLQLCRCRDLLSLIQTWPTRLYRRRPRHTRDLGAASISLQCRAWITPVRGRAGFGARDRLHDRGKGRGRRAPALVMLGPMLQRRARASVQAQGAPRDATRCRCYELVVAKGGREADAGHARWVRAVLDFSVSPQPPLAARTASVRQLTTRRNADGGYVYIAEMTTVDDFFLSWGDRFWPAHRQQDRHHGPGSDPFCTTDARVRAGR